mgnify:CR=1 FL=1
MLPTADGNRMYNRVPYDFQFEMVIRTKHITEMNQIVEQICPYFTPYMNIKAIDNADFNVPTDLILSLDSISPPDSFEGSIGDDRIVETSMSFVMEAYLYKAKTTSAVIRSIDFSFVDYDDHSKEIDSTITIGTP